MHGLTPRRVDRRLMGKNLPFAVAAMGWQHKACYIRAKAKRADTHSANTL